MNLVEVYLFSSSCVIRRTFLRRVIRRVGGLRLVGLTLSCSTRSGSILRQRASALRCTKSGNRWERHWGIWDCWTRISVRTRCSTRSGRWRLPHLSPSQPLVWQRLIVSLISASQALVGTIERSYGNPTVSGQPGPIVQRECKCRRAWGCLQRSWPGRDVHHGHPSLLLVARELRFEPAARSGLGPRKGSSNGFWPFRRLRACAPQAPDLRERISAI
jgi:hypothetical protein